MKQGFVIARNRSNKQFFSAKGSYERPHWTHKVEEATVYYSDGMAQAAVKKLWVNGNFPANVIVLSELSIDFQAPTHTSPPASHEEQPSMSDEVSDHDAPHGSSEDLPSADDASSGASEEPLDHEEPDGDEDLDDEDMDGDGDNVEASDEDLGDDHEEDLDDEDLDDEDFGDEDLEGETDHEEGPEASHGDEEVPSEEPSVSGDDIPDEEISREEECASMYAEGQFVVWKEQIAEVIHARRNATSVIIRVDGKDQRVPVSELSESTEAVNPQMRDAAYATMGSVHAGHGDEPSVQELSRGARRVGIRVGEKMYDFGRNYPAAMGFYRSLTPDEQKMAKFVGETFRMPARPDKQGNAKPTENTNLIPNLKEPKYMEIDLDDPVGAVSKPFTDLDYATAYQHGEKVPVPGNVKAALRDSIETFRKAADYNNGRDDAQASFCMTVCSALEELQDHLNQGTVDGVKQAQIKVSSWMNPITTNIPEVVRDFVYYGGRKKSLRDLFDIKKGEAMLAKVRGGLNYPKGK